MLTPDQIVPATFPGRPGQAKPTLIPTVNGLPARCDLIQRTSSTPGRERHGLGFLLTHEGAGAWAPLAEWRWEAN